MSLVGDSTTCRGGHKTRGLLATECMESIRLVIRTTWDGAELAAGEETSVEVRLGDGLTVLVDAPYHGDPMPGGAPGRLDRLWEHEVVEVFLAEAPTCDARYLEVELGPHGHWLALAFEGYRRRVAEDLVLDLRAGRVGNDGARWRGVAHVASAELGRALSRIGAVNAYAIHGAGGARRHLAACPVPAGRYEAPDFHRLQHSQVIAEEDPPVGSRP